jgi:hypothetical protein
MKSQKTWLTINFYEGEADIEATLNYETKSYVLTHLHNDNNVTFKSEEDASITVSLDRAKCVMAALKFIKTELEL